MSLGKVDKTSELTSVLQRWKHQMVFVRETQLKILSCFVPTVSGLRNTHRFSKESETPPSITPGILFGPGDGKWQTKNKLFQQTVSQICREDLTCHDFQAQKSHKLTGLPFFMNSLSCIPHTHYVFSTSLQKSCTAISQGARQRLQAGCDPCTQGPTPSPAGSFSTLKRHFNSPSSCFSRRAVTRDSVTGISLCSGLLCAWNSKRAAKVTGSLTVTQQLVSSWVINGNGQALQKTHSTAQWMLGLLPILHCWHKPETTADDFAGRWNRHKPKATQQSC